MRTRGVLRIAAALRRLTLVSVAAAVLTLVSLHAFDRGYGTTDEDVCAVAGCPAMAPALAELVESQQALGMHCTSTPRLSDVVAVDDGRGGATLSSLADVVATSVGMTPRTVVYCR
ncbi:hypothetical protein [Aeromicrobium sp. Leaf291]|uniref:hypothetical protein n=1 Tax=Aeromicrobium sp. Leaf291 TaxID=1736325 RepID=UPI0006F74A58|nr:hypothetical protein [Aeromicrobium sp. Leaf291]KQP81945.1 hypothetical protein ASF35_10795 [Aeromicrobium sp. Leaf291]